MVDGRVLETRADGVDSACEFGLRGIVLRIDVADVINLLARGGLDLVLGEDAGAGAVPECQ